MHDASESKISKGVMAVEEKLGVKSSSSIVPCFLFVEVRNPTGDHGRGRCCLAYYFEYTDTFPVSTPVLIYSLVTAIPTLTILVGELCAFFTKAEGTQEKTIVTADCCYFNPLLRRIIRFLGVYAFGLFTTTIFANAGQVVTGNQTPHFLSACRPNYTALGCQSTMQYIAERRACTGNPLIVMSARKSFPSKDAALSVYSAVFSVMYVTLVFKTKGTRLTKPTISLTLFCLAMLVGVIRVAEYRNHWADVLAGFFTGGAIAVFLVTCVINNFQQMLPNPPPPRPLRPESVLGMPMVTLPCVESPLEKLRGDLRSPRSHDHQPYRSPATPDVLIPSRSISSEV
uniref:Phospholipid phosphatase-related protein type 5 n=1 Tax=Cyclopterus lumpus TaxID=8103 RepID=A0A8C3ASN4_CYCLU